MFFSRRSPTRARHTRLEVETLESRLVLATVLPGPLLEVEGNDTLNVAQTLGTLASSDSATVLGTIGNSPAGAADVDWYSFTLTAASRVKLQTLNPESGSQQVPILSLFNNPAPFSDPTSPYGSRLLFQSEAVAGGNAAIDEVLAPGTYFVGVSGSGNRYFSPNIADSGATGSTGDYALLTQVFDAGVVPTDGPVVLGVDPNLTQPLAGSPQVIRVRFSTQMDSSTFVFDTDPSFGNVFLTYNPTGNFGDGNDQAISLTWTATGGPTDELQLVPDAPLGRGFYRITLSGDSMAHGLVLGDLFGNPLGANSANPSGQDFGLTFQINGVEGDTSASPVANDTPAGAINLGTLGGTLVQVSGTIGDDPEYSPLFGSTPYPAGSDVDLYHFVVTGDHQALTAEAFAGRIGSPLDVALTLYRKDPNTGQLVLVDSNDNTLNDYVTADGMIPLFTDAALLDGLTAGEYYLAVSSTSNVFDPMTSHSGFGFSTGDYVLNLRVTTDAVPPQVVSTSITSGSPLTAPPTLITVQFSEAVNLQQLAFLAGQQSLPGPNVFFVRDANGVNHYARLQSYNVATSQAVFLMLEAVPNGAAELHLSGSLGLTDFAGNALLGNVASGDFVVPFAVNGPARGSPGNPLVWASQEPNKSVAQPQQIGTLFPKELQTGVDIVRDYSASPASAPADTADVYRFEVLQSRPYIFRLTGKNLPVGTKPVVYDSNGKTLSLLALPGGNYSVTLAAGTYTVRVGGWTTVAAPTVSYTLRVRLATSGENPTPLTVGPAPAFRITLGNGSPAPTTPILTPPATTLAVLPTTSVATTDPLGVFRGLPSGVFSGLGSTPVGGVRAANGGNQPLNLPGNLLTLPPTESLSRGSQFAILTSGSEEAEDVDASNRTEDGSQGRPATLPTQTGPGTQTSQSGDPRGNGTSDGPGSSSWRFLVDSVFQGLHSLPRSSGGVGPALPGGQEQEGDRLADVASAGLADTELVRVNDACWMALGNAGVVVPVILFHVGALAMRWRRTIQNRLSNPVQGANGQKNA